MFCPEFDTNLAPILWTKEDIFRFGYYKKRTPQYQVEQKKKSLNVLLPFSSL